MLVSIAASWRLLVLQSSAHRRFSNFKEGTEPVQHRPQIRASVMPPSSRSGTIDPTKAARLALQGAAPVASLLITTEVMVAKKNRQDLSTNADHVGQSAGFRIKAVIGISFLLESNLLRQSFCRLVTYGTYFPMYNGNLFSKNRPLKYFRRLLTNNK